MKDKRHEVSNQAFGELLQVAYAQDNVGMKKYNTPLHTSLSYDWDAMIDEELVDLIKYRQCEKQRKVLIIELLQNAMKSPSPKAWVETALEILTIKGTGK